MRLRLQVLLNANSGNIEEKNNSIHKLIELCLKSIFNKGSLTDFEKYCFKVKKHPG